LESDCALSPDWVLVIPDSKVFPAWAFL
jgi:hypothetical protein